MFKYSSHDLAELAHQLTLSPARQRLRQLDGIEQLLGIIERDQAYPYDLVCFHITGYRRRQGEHNRPTIPGDRLTADLVTMAEHLTRKTEVSVDELADGVRTLEELAAHLNVSTKTIRRWRTRGLMGLRVRDKDGVARVVFRNRTVERFVSKNAEMVTRGASFRQLTEAEKKDIVDRARQKLEQQRCKLHVLARAIAGETGRAVETVRYTLRRHDHENPDQALFGQGGQPRLSQRYLAIWKCHEAGEPAAQIAATLGLSVADVEQVLCEVEARALVESPPSYIHNELFDAPTADALILDVPVPQPAEAMRTARPPKDLPPYLRSLYETPLLTPEQEQDLFRRYNYLKYKAARAIANLDVCAVSARMLEQIRGWMKQSEEIRQQIVRANLRLVVSIAKRHVGWSPSFQEVISDGNMSLIRAVEKFDFARGYKFSTYAHWAIMKNYARTIPESHYHVRRFVTGQDELLETASAAVNEATSESDAEHIRRVLAESMNELSERERVVVTNHYGLFGTGQPQTLEELGKRFGVTKERIRQIEKKAIAKIRRVLSPTIAEFLAG